MRPLSIASNGFLGGTTLSIASNGFLGVLSIDARARRFFSGRKQYRQKHVDDIQEIIPEYDNNDNILVLLLSVMT